ncbi:MAG TPA: hypothetical protein VGU23_09430, partial [Acidobacteriaceae bacterium]|nr:hypothetical protein [Acidobacteriaceae bacterium]
MIFRHTRRLQVFLLLPVLSASLLSHPATAQMADSPSAAAQGAATAASAGPAPSAVMRPALASLRDALDMLRPERWKAPGAITAESTNDVGSIERDLDATLPPLLADADAGRSSTAQLLPAYRNVEALYDVVVRV